MLQSVEFNVIAPRTRNLHQLELEVTGMVCDGCSTAVRNVVTTLAGVDDARVDHESGTACVVHGDQVDVATILDAIRDAGFGATVLDQP